MHGSFLFLLGYVAWAGWGDGRAPGMIWSAVMLLAFFGCVVLHELGHSFTAMRFGIGVRRILLMPIGGMAEFDAIPRLPRREILMTLAGPAVNYVIALLLWPLVPGILADLPPFSLGGTLQQLFWANVIMGTFNLLPAFPMDGGRILRAVLALRLPYLTATRRAAWTGKILCILGALTALFAPELGLGPHPLWLVTALFAFIFVAGELEYRFVARREREEAHWRATLARLQHPGTPAAPDVSPAEERG